jgi:sugar O-acyltransferase (sialic acid O-acetyltransferase NeuD family)
MSDNHGWPPVSARAGLLGAGGHAREIRSYLPPGTSTFNAVSAEFLGQAGEDLIDITDPSRSDRATPVVAAVGAPGLRRKLVEQWPGNSYFVLVAPDTHVSPETDLAPGSVIAPGVVITTGVSLGAHTHINIGATISHDCSLGSFVTISPGVHLGGHVTVADGVFIGIGASVAPGVRLATGVVVGAGATVLRDVLEPNAVVAGVPASPISLNAGWLDEL